MVDLDSGTCKWPEMWVCLKKRIRDSNPKNSVLSNKNTVTLVLNKVLGRLELGRISIAIMNKLL